jgi:hypothetical protein
VVAVSLPQNPKTPFAEFKYLTNTNGSNETCWLANFKAHQLVLCDEASAKFGVKQELVHVFYQRGVVSS